MKHEIKTVSNLLHRLWSKAVGTSDYNKAEWRLLAMLLPNQTAEIPESLKKQALLKEDSNE